MYFCNLEAKIHYFFDNFIKIDFGILGFKMYIIEDPKRKKIFAQCINAHIFYTKSAEVCIRFISLS